jgi:hypothetical protein
MKDVASHATVAKPETSARIRQIVRNEIRLKWGKFSDQDLSALKDNNDLVAQRAAKYGLEKAQAQRDVDLLMKGRQI